MIVCGVYRAGDMVCCWDPGWCRRGIGLAQRMCPERYSRDEARTWHIGQVGGEGWPYVYEATARGGVVRTDYARTEHWYYVLRHRDRGMNEAGLAPWELMRRWSEHGVPYDGLGIAGMAWKAVTGLVRHGNAWHEYGGVFCAEADALSAKMAGCGLPTMLAPCGMWPAEYARMGSRGFVDLVVNADDPGARVPVWLERMAIGE